MDNNSTNTKYIAIKTKGKELFWKYGLKRVSIEEICKEAQVSKMTFYKFFPNKMELALMILTEILNNSLVKFKGIVESDISFTEKVKELFLLKMAGSKEISIEFISDFNKFPDSGLQSLVEEKGAVSMQIFIDFFLSSQKNGFIRSDIKIDFVLNYLNIMHQMFDNKTLVEQYEKPEDLILESLTFLFYGMCSKNE